MDLSNLVQVISKFAPLIGAALPLPGGVIFGEMIAQAFGGDIKNPADLIKRIENDPEAEIKIKTIESNQRIELERLSVERKKAQLLDVANARENNIKNTKKSDEFIKLFLVVSLSGIVYLCLYALIKGEVNGVEANIISSILGSSFTAVLAMVYFYWGNSV